VPAMPRSAIFVSGAAAGIGRATAELFSSRGWYVGVFDINEPAVQELRQKLGEQNSVAGFLDVTDPLSFENALEQFWTASGQRLDVMFNNAGIVSVGDFESIALSRHQAIADVNYKGVLNGCYLALPYLKQMPASVVLNMSSAAALYGSPSYASYSASKFAVRGLTEALNIEWARHRIAVMSLMPLFVKTAMVTDIEPPQSLRRLGVHLSPGDIAKTAWRAAHWPRAWPRVHWYPGARTLAMALLNKLTPSWLSRLTSKWMSGY
jgi:NADP-dependent 3-hydroxy acid dehydrogenase YdfG